MWKTENGDIIYLYISHTLESTGQRCTPFATITFCRNCCGTPKFSCAHTNMVCNKLRANSRQIIPRNCRELLWLGHSFFGYIFKLQNFHARVSKIYGLISGQRTIPQLFASSGVCLIYSFITRDRFPSVYGDVRQKKNINVNNQK